MTIFKPCRVGDIGDYRDLRVDGVDTLVGASIQAHVTNGVDTAWLDCEILDPVARWVRLKFGTLDGWLNAGPTVGFWRIEYAITFADGSERTWPDEPDRIQVRPQIA